MLIIYAPTGFEVVTVRIGQLEQSTGNPYVSTYISSFRRAKSGWKYERLWTRLHNFKSDDSKSKLRPAPPTYAASDDLIAIPEYLNDQLGVWILMHDGESGFAPVQGDIDRLFSLGDRRLLVGASIYRIANGRLIRETSNVPTGDALLVKGAHLIIRQRQPLQDVHLFHQADIIIYDLSDHKVVLPDNLERKSLSKYLSYYERGRFGFGPIINRSMSHVVIDPPEYSPTPNDGSLKVGTREFGYVVNTATGPVVRFTARPYDFSAFFAYDSPADLLVTFQYAFRAKAWGIERTFTAGCYLVDVHRRNISAMASLPREHVAEFGGVPQLFWHGDWSSVFKKVNGPPKIYQIVK